MNRPGSQYKRLKRIVFSVPAMLVLAALVAAVGTAAWNMRQTYQDTQETVDRLREEKQELAGRLEAAQSAAAQVSTNRGLREEIRNKFSVAKPGERVIVLNDSNRQPATTTTDESPGFWQQVADTVWPF
jgi:cell division protein FtsB